MKPGLKRGLKRIAGFVLVAGALTTLGGCVYGPGYYQRPGVVYDDDSYGPDGRGAAVYDDDSDYYYSGPGYYSPYGYGYAWPWIGLGFYGSYYGGYHGPWRGGYHGHGSWGGGSWHGHPSHSGGTSSHSTTSHGSEHH